VNKECEAPIGGPRFNVIRPLAASAVALLLSAAATLSSGDEPDAVRCFDGKSLAGWVAEHSEHFSARDGVLVQQGGTGWLRSEKSYTNFEFQAEVRVAKEAVETGFVFRASPESTPKDPFWPAKGYQLQISDGESCFMLFGHGTMPPRFERKGDLLSAARKPPGEWQKIAVKVVGTRMEVRLNGVVVTTSNTIQVKSGHLGLLGKTGQVGWREMKIRVYPAG
jgi:hypothetical protein